MAASYMHDSLASMVRSSEQISRLPFRRTNILAHAALADEEWFETHLIRDAAPHERALFRATEGGTVAEPDQMRRGGEEWTATKRAGPKRATQGKELRASPLKERRTAPGGQDPRRALVAAQKLLVVYPLTRATAHVEALLDQFEDLQRTISEHEESLKRPLPRDPAATSESDKKNEKDKQREDEIKREEMEIFALKQMIAEKKEELEVIKAKPTAKVAPPKTSPAVSRKQSLPSVSPATAESYTRETPAVRRARARKSSLSLQTNGLSSTSTPDEPTTPHASSSAITPTASPSKSARRSLSNAPSYASLTTASAAKTTPPRQRVVSAPSPRVAASLRKKTAVEESSSPVSSPVRIGKRASLGGTPTASPTASPTATPKARRTAPSSHASISPEELELVANKIWSSIGDSLRPWARKLLASEDEDVPSPLTHLAFAQTLRTVSSILALPPAGESDPLSPVSSKGTLSSEAEDSDPLPPPPSTVLELRLLQLILLTLSGSPPSPDLKLVLRDPVLASSLHLPGGKEPMVSMNALKAQLGDPGSASTAVYGLVGKSLLRIDRRGGEGPMVGFRGA